MECGGNLKLIIPEKYIIRLASHMVFSSENTIHHRSIFMNFKNKLVWIEYKTKTLTETAVLLLLLQARNYNHWHTDCRFPYHGIQWMEQHGSLPSKNLETEETVHFPQHQLLCAVKTWKNSKLIWWQYLRYRSVENHQCIFTMTKL